MHWYVAFLIGATIALTIVLAMFTIAGIISLLCDSDFKSQMIRIRREYGIVLSPLRLGAIYQSIRWSLGASYWKPVSSTITYGWPIFLLQFFKFETDSNKAARRQALYTKLINRETGYDQ